MSFKYPGRRGFFHAAIMVKEKLLEMQCVVSDAVPDSRFLVTHELSPCDLSKGRITFRHIQRGIPKADHPTSLIQPRHLKIIE